MADEKECKMQEGEGRGKRVWQMRRDAKCKKGRGAGGWGEGLTVNSKRAALSILKSISKSSTKHEHHYMCSYGSYVPAGGG